MSFFLCLKINYKFIYKEEIIVENQLYRKEHSNGRKKKN